MSDEAKRKPLGLGRGLSALLGEDPGDLAPGSRGRGDRRVPIASLRPNRFQPRHQFDDHRIAELVVSMRERGVLQPLIVRPVEDQPDSYEIIAGERRWRAAQRAGLHDLPVVVKDYTDAQSLEVALIENIQRQDLTPIEEAKGYRQLMENFGHNQERLGQVVGKSRSHVANLLRLLSLPEPVQDMITEGVISMGHARTLVNSHDPLALARVIAARGLNVRQTEKLVKKAKGDGAARAPRPAKVKDADTRVLERNISGALGLQVAIDDRKTRGGVVKITYKTLDQLDEICRRLSQTPGDG